MFRTAPLSIIRSSSLYTQQWYMPYRFADSLRAVPSWSCLQVIRKHVWHIPLLCPQWKTPDYVQRNCPEYVDFYSKNYFEKLVHLVGFYYKNSGKTSFKIQWGENRLLRGLSSGNWESLGWSFWPFWLYFHRSHRRTRGHSSQNR